MKTRKLWKQAIPETNMVKKHGKKTIFKQLK